MALLGVFRPFRGALTRITRSAVIGAGILLSSAHAEAHLSLEQGGTHKSRYGDSAIKDGPCGQANGARGSNVYTYKPGETITVRVREYVMHPGYFRIAFDEDGDDDFMEPRSIKPVEGHRNCLNDGVDKCGSSDFYNNPTVLLDNLDPHVASLADAPVDREWEVTLPDVECDNCTLQIIQVMEDTIHGPYSPKGASPEVLYIEDIYHTCIDLVLKRDATGEENPEPAPFEPLPSGEGDGDGSGAVGDGDSDPGGPVGHGEHDAGPAPGGDGTAAPSSGGAAACSLRGNPGSPPGGAAGLFVFGLAVLGLVRRGARAPQRGTTDVHA